MDIDYPFQIDSRGGTAQTGLYDHIRDMIEQLIFTSPGERVNRPDFGSGALQLVFAPNSPELAATVRFTLQAALQRTLDDVIQVNDLRVSASDATLQIEIDYVVRKTGQAVSATFARTT